MRLVKFEHSCVRLESGAAVLVIDPGGFTTPRALDGVDAVLITHEHADHFDVGRLTDALARRPAVRIFTHTAVMALLGDLAEAVTTIRSGDAFEAAGFQVRAYGGWHAPIHADVPRVPNLGFLVQERLYHPGDSFDVPHGARVETLCVPISGPWLKAADSVEFVRAVAPRQAFALHDHLLSPAGLGIVDGLLDRLLGTTYRRLEPGADVSV